MLISTSLAPPKALDRISFVLPKLISAASLSVTLINQLESDGARSRIASLGASHGFRNGASVFVTAYTDFINRRDSGIFAGFSWAFDKDTMAMSQAAAQGGAVSVNTQAAKTAGEDVGSYGWRLSDQEGANCYSEASGLYVSTIGKASIKAGEYGSGRTWSTAASADMAGGITMLPGAVKLALPIADSFALVDAGAPGVAVLEDNRVVGKTDSGGQLLLPRLRGLEDNKIAIDPTTLPPSAQVGMTETTLKPRAHSGVRADFKVSVNARDAEIILVDPSGAPLPVGSLVDLPGVASSVVGYDGRAYLSGLTDHNVLKVRTAGKICSAEFDYHAAKGAARPTVGPLPCRTAPTPR